MAGEIGGEDWGAQPLLPLSSVHPVHLEACVQCFRVRVPCFLWRVPCFWACVHRLGGAQGTRDHQNEHADRKTRHAPQKTRHAGQKTRHAKARTLGDRLRAFWPIWRLWVLEPLPLSSVHPARLDGPMARDMFSRVFLQRTSAWHVFACLHLDNVSSRPLA